MSDVIERKDNDSVYLDYAAMVVGKSYEFKLGDDLYSLVKDPDGAVNFYRVMEPQK